MKIMLLMMNYTKTGLLPKMMLAQSNESRKRQPCAATVILIFAVFISSLCLFYQC